MIVLHLYKYLLYSFNIFSLHSFMVSKPLWYHTLYIFSLYILSWYLSTMVYVPLLSGLLHSFMVSESLLNGILHPLSSTWVYFRWSFTSLLCLGFNFPWVFVSYHLWESSSSSWDCSPYLSWNQPNKGLGPLLFQPSSISKPNPAITAQSSQQIAAQSELTIDFDSLNNKEMNKRIKIGNWEFY